MKEESDIPEIDFKLTSVTVKAKVRKLKTTRDYIGGNLFRWLKHLWYWYWWRSRTISWESFLNTQFTWEPQMDTEIHAYHSLDAEKELNTLLEEYKKLNNE